MHADPSAALVLALAVILVAAKLGGDLAVRIGQPAVLGELVAGVVLGNAGLHFLEGVKTDPFVDMFARVGVLLLLFEVGLESTVAQMLKVGLSSVLVATLGVIAPFALGWGVGAWLLPAHGMFMHAFLGATLTATSVGITARVLKDLGKSTTPEARIILGAAVVDDVMGLVILAVMSGIAGAMSAGTSLAPGPVVWIIAKALLFLGGAIALGLVLAPHIFRLAARLRAAGVLLATGLSFCFVLAWLAAEVGLAPIVGAFAAGLLLEESHAQVFVARGEDDLERLVHPVSSFLVPVFFVLMGMRVNVAEFGRPGIALLAGALTVAAIVGKQVCSAGGIAPKGEKLDRFALGLGMIPRGEVGLIFADLGRSLTVQGERIVDDATYAAVVIMVIVTTMVTPPLLAWRLKRN